MTERTWGEGYNDAGGCCGLTRYSGRRDRRHSRTAMTLRRNESPPPSRRGSNEQHQSPGGFAHLPGLFLVGRIGIEPITLGLRVPCSAN